MGQCAHHRRRRSGRQVRPRGAQHSADRCSAGSGDQCRRHPPPPEARSDQGSARRAGGTVRMSKLRHYDVIRNPVVTEKSTMASEHGQVVFDVAIDATKTEIKAAVEALFSVKVKAVNTSIRKGKVKRFRQELGTRKDVKKAIVTLADGQSIDISTGI